MSAQDDADRREEIRRAGDRVIEMRFDRLEEMVGEIRVTLQGLGSAVGHLALLDDRSDENRRRIGSVEKKQLKLDEENTTIRITIEGLRTRLLFICGLGSLAGSGLVLLLAQLIGASPR